MPKLLKELSGGKLVDAVSGQDIKDVAVRDLMAGDKIQRQDGFTEEIIERTVTGEGFTYVRTTRMKGV